MAISIVHTTTASLTNASFTVNIPAVTAGNTVIVAASTAAGSGPANNIDHVQDSDAIFLSYTATAVGSRANDGGVGRTTSIWYRTNLPGGETQVLCVPNNNTGMNMNVVVYEVSGVNYAAPVEHNTVRSATDTNTTTTSGTAITTAFTNALFIAVSNSTAASWGSGIYLNSWSTDFKGSVGANTWIIGHRITSGTQTAQVSHATASAAFIIATADFNPTANATTANLFCMFD